MFSRTIGSAIRRELVDYGKSVLLLGPRQVGKSTLAVSLSPSLSINFARESTYRDHLKDPELLVRLTHALTSKDTVFLDEVQRLPFVLNTVQSLVDSADGPRFLMTGSSARKLRKEGVNLLPGRIFSHRLFPLTYWELGHAFDLEKCLSKGTLPEVYLQPYGAELLQDYIDIYLREEILAEGIVRNMGSFGSFLDVAAKIAGQAINYSQLASDTEIPKESLRRYFDILEDTLVGYRLAGYQGARKSRKAVQREKFLFFDLGVRNGILKIQNNVFQPEEYGALFEQWLILQLFACASYHRKPWHFFYYRDDAKNEVDLVVEGPRSVCAIEIKWGARFKREWTKGLRAFSQEAAKPVRSLVVYRGEHIQKDDDITLVPFERFLQELETFIGF